MDSCFLVLNVFIFNLSIFSHYLEPVYEEAHPCNPSPCGSNTVCKERNGVGSCTCIPEYFGDPYVGCKPECSINSDCSREKACIRNKCQDPCPGVCGINAFCRIINHNPSCSCNDDYTGDPLSSCHEIFKSRKGKLSNTRSRKSLDPIIIYSQPLHQQIHVTLHHVGRTHNVGR